jgi:hypothetical protein
MKESNYEFYEYKPYFDGFLELKSWGCAFMSGLVDMSETWDPM